MTTLKLSAVSLSLCALTWAQGILGTPAWTGTVQIKANQTGSGSSSFAGATINETWTHDSSAQFTVTLSKDPTNGRRWTGQVQGPVSISNKNVMVIAFPVLACNGTLFWIGSAPSLSTQMTLEADATGTSYRFWITPNTIPAPNSGSVVCPTTALEFPTVDPNSPFIPNLETETATFPVSGPGTQLTGSFPYLGDSGIGGFVASPARVAYDVSWDLKASADVATNESSIAHIATGNGWQTTFVLVNTGTSPAQTTLRFFADGTGAPLSIPLTFPQSGNSSSANSVSQTLAAGASLIVQSVGPVNDPAPTIGSARLATTGNVGGFVIFRYNPNGQEAVVPMENRTANGYLIAFDNIDGTATGVAINNASALAANVPVIVRDDAGSQIAADTLPLAGNGHTSFTLGVDRYPAAAGKRGTIEFGVPTGAKIGVLGIRISPLHTFTTLPALVK